MTESEKWLQDNELHECLVLEASISVKQCNRNRRYYKTGLDRGYITIQNPVKYKKSCYCSSVCNGLKSKENIDPSKATIA